MKYLAIVCLIAVIISIGIADTTDNTQYLVQFLNAKGRLFCIGALVRPQYVVTAAHCFPNGDGSKTTVVGGATAENEEGVQREIERVILHKDYGARTMHSDVAVIKLDEPMTGDNIKPIELCSQDLRKGIFLQVSGWNEANDYEPLSEQLRTISARYAPAAMCDKAYGKYVKENIFCIFGKEVKGLCTGDSGGPAVYRGELCGINAFGHWCQHGGQPNALTNVFKVRAFIESAFEE